MKKQAKQKEVISDEQKYQTLLEKEYNWHGKKFQFCGDELKAFQYDNIRKVLKAFQEALQNRQEIAMLDFKASEIIDFLSNALREVGTDWTQQNMNVMKQFFNEYFPSSAFVNEVLGDFFYISQSTFLYSTRLMVQKQKLIEEMFRQQTEKLATEALKNIQTEIKEKTQ